MIVESSIVAKAVRKEVIKKMVITLLILIPIFFVINHAHLIFTSVDRATITLLKTILGVTALVILLYMLFQESEKCKIHHNVLQTQFINDLYATFILDTEARLIRVNPSFMKIFNVSEETLKGKHFVELLPDQEKEHNMTLFHQIFQGHSERFETILSVGTRSIEAEVMAMPILLKREVIGMICVCFDVSERNDVQRRSNILANIDGLTGVFNRRYFDKTIEKEWKRAARHQSEISLIMLDIDHFKKYNDMYGHVQGDECLIDMTASIQTLLKRPSDFIARYGGEEFAVVLPDTNQTGASLLAEILRKNIEDNLDVTISLGVATCVPTPESVPSDLIERADKALYHAKEAGRNQVKVNELIENK